MTGGLRIGIDIRPLGTASGRRGIGSYIRGLLGGLAEETRDGRADILLFGHQEETSEGLPASLTRVRLRRPRRGIILWDQAAWLPLLARRRVSVFHSPFYAVPWLSPRRCRIVQTVHDLTPLKIPGCVSSRDERVFRANFKLARRADRIIVPSEATRTDVIELLDVRAEALVVIPEACDVTPDELVTAREELPTVLAKLGIPESRRYLLHTGGHDRVKNLPRLLDAFATLRGQGRRIDLVVSGEHGPDTSGIIGQAAARGLLDGIRFPGHLPRRDLIALYVGAAALVYPSLAEGFGLPVMEAMACGTPVVASSAGSLPEVGGDACLFVSPDDAEEMASAIASILDDDAHAAELSCRGRERAATFSWRETARRTLAVYREVAA